MRRRVLTGLLIVVALTGCGEGSTEPVPTSASEPFLCDGIPLTGLQRMTGLDELSAEEITEWDDSYICRVQDEEGATAVFVDRDDQPVPGMGSPEDQLAAALGSGGVEVTAPAPGRGYVRSDGQIRARWACDDGVRTEIILQHPAKGREPTEDLSRYLVSILPWVCGDEEAPSATSRSS